MCNQEILSTKEKKLQQKKMFQCKIVNVTKNVKKTFNFFA